MSNYNPNVFTRYDESDYRASAGTPDNAHIGSVPYSARIGERVEAFLGEKGTTTQGFTERSGGFGDTYDHLDNTIRQHRAARDWDEQWQSDWERGIEQPQGNQLTEEQAENIARVAINFEETTGQQIGINQLVQIIRDHGYASTGLTEAVEQLADYIGGSLGSRLRGELERQTGGLLPQNMGDLVESGTGGFMNAIKQPVINALRNIKHGIVGSITPILRAISGSFMNNKKMTSAAVAGTIGAIAYRKDIGNWLTTLYNRIIGGQATEEEKEEVKKLVNEHVKFKGSDIVYAIESGNMDFDDTLFNAVFNAVKSRDRQTAEQAKIQVYNLIMARSYIIHRRTMDNLDNALRNGGRVVPRMGNIPFNPSLDSPYAFGWTPKPRI